VLLELSEEYDIGRIKCLVEKQMISKLNEFNRNASNVTKTRKLYGKQIDVELESFVDLLELCNIYCLKKLRLECIRHVAQSFQTEMIEAKMAANVNIDPHDLLDIFRKKLQVADEKLMKKEQRLKMLEDENLKQKFEIKRLKLAAENVP
jgi:hypothetical protein